MPTRLGAGEMITAALLAGMAQTGGAETPVDRTILPIPPAPYTNVGQIGVSYRNSVPQMHPPLTAPAGAPNVLLILIDDAGYGQTATFGGLIETPTLDHLAACGLRYTRFHVTALCSPSRAALLTGRNHHSVGMGSLPDFGSGYPGYDGNIPKSAAFISETLRENGYSTAAFGKWHLAPVWELSSSGPFDHWPTGQGFDTYHGYLGGATDQWHPVLYEGTQPITMRVPPGRKGDYTLNEDLANQAIAWIRREKSVTPNRPFFVYYAPGATHLPLQAPKAWIHKYKGKFDMGWDRYREIVFERQKRLGVIPPDAQLTPRPAELPAWDSISPDQKKIYARLMEVFAGFMAQSDHEIGRVVDAIAAAGQLDNTLIFYIAGDNGASPEDLYGSFNETAAINHVPEDVGWTLRHLDELGSATSSPHYPAAWGWAGNTPFQWGKQVASHFGGTRDPLVVSWPARIKDVGGIRGQFSHLIDIAPTILEAAGLPQPVSVDGVRQMPIEGISMVYSFSSASAADRRTTQYFEMFANRAIYHDGWIAAARGGRVPWLTRGDPDSEKQPWELYEVSRDYSERTNLAAARPDKLKEMQALFLVEARKYHVLPLDAREEERRTSSSMRPTLNPGRTVYTYLSSPLHLLYNVAPAVRNHSLTISADIVVPPGGGDGIITAEGGHFGGYALFVQGGRIEYTYNYIGREWTTLASPEKLPAGPVRIDFGFKYDGGGLGKGGRATLAVNGKRVAEKVIPRTAPVSFAYQETFDVGEDRGSPVGDYASPFRFQGEIRRVTFDIAPGNLAPAAQTALHQAERVAAEIDE